MRGLHIYGVTHTGAVRQANEDHVLIGRWVKNSGGYGVYLSQDDDGLARSGFVCAVADGVGGEAGGATASWVALNQFDAQFYSLEKRDDPARLCEEAVRAAAERANRTVLAMATNKPELRGMGCTLAGICMFSGGHLIFHAGDSRVYRFRSGGLKQLTADDSVLGAAQQLGLAEALAEDNQYRHTITNCVGDQDFRLHVQTGKEMRDGDVYVICSDGLHDLVDLETCEAILGHGPTVEASACALLEEALKNGGRDNISIICIQPEVFEDVMGWRRPAQAVEAQEDAEADAELAAPGIAPPVSAAIAAEAEDVPGA
jgi:serine/threonine protein phosphatase PrpC